MLDFFLFLIPLAVFPPLSLFLIYEYIFYLSPINSMIGMPEASSFNLPIIFLFALLKYGLFSG